MTAGSIVILKLLRRRKKFYYKIQNFTSVSGYAYWMKQNAVGLASILVFPEYRSSSDAFYYGMSEYGN